MKVYTGETLEQKIERIVHNGEPITDGAPITYTERKEGVNPATNIRTDRFEIAVDAMDKVTKADVAARNSRIEERNQTTITTDIVSPEKPVETGK